MPIAEANGIQIAHEVFGDQSKPAVLLIAGVMAQLSKPSISIYRRRKPVLGQTF